MYLEHTELQGLKQSQSKLIVNINSLFPLSLASMLLEHEYVGAKTSPDVEYLQQHHASCR